MNPVSTNQTMMLDWAVAAKPLKGESESGDLHVVQVFPQCALLAVIDGLGHGSGAAVAARTAAELLSQGPMEPVSSLLQRCHDGLKLSRGVALSLVQIDARMGTFTWLGVGDVEGVLLRGLGGGKPGREFLLMRGGVVGYQLPALRPVTMSIVPGDTLVLATDGVRFGFADHPDLSRSPRAMADDILAKFAKGTDDALVLVARYLGGSL